MNLQFFLRLFSISSRRAAQIIFYSKHEGKKLRFSKRNYLIFGAIFFFIFALFFSKRSPSFLGNSIKVSAPLIFVCSPNECNEKELLMKVRAAPAYRVKEVFCASSSCMYLFRSRNRMKKVFIARLRLWELAENTPLESFMRMHNLIKLRMGAEYTQLVHKLSVLLVMYHRGGHYMDSNLDEKFFERPQELPFIRKSGDHEWIHPEGLWTSCTLYRGSSIVTGIMQEIENTLQKYGLIDPNLNEVVKYVLREYDYKMRPVKRPRVPEISKTRHYGILSYDHSAAITRLSNTGDEIQALAGLQFLPYNDVFLDRNTWKILPKSSTCTYSASEDDDVHNRVLIVQGNNCSIVSKPKSVTAFLNAWYGRSRQHWPPPPEINPLMFAMYMGSLMQEVANTREGIEYFNKHKPIGSRDTATLDYFNNMNIKSYLSGCATLLLHKYPDKSKERTKVYSVDVKREALEKVVPARILRGTLFRTHHQADKQRFNRSERYERAFRMVDMYSEAKLVMTSRIHVALPCVAMGIPVVFFETHDLPGGGGNRTAGLTDMFHTVRLTKNMKKAVGLNRFNWDNPKPNPNHQKVMKYRSRIWHRVRMEKEMRDTAITFGNIPFAVHRRPEEPQQHIFQFVQEESFSIVALRSLESILLTQPFAKVSIFSNTLEANAVDSYIESGYDITLKGYSMEDCLVKLLQFDRLSFGNAIHKFSNQLSRLRYGNAMRRNEEGLMRLAVLYINGGTYVNSDLILLKNTRNLTNVMSIEKGENESEDFSQPNFLNFKQKNPIIKASILEFMTSYDPRNKSFDSISILEDISKSFEDSNCLLSETDNGEVERTSENCHLETTSFDPFYPLTWIQRTNDCRLHNRIGSHLRDEDLRDSYGVTIENLHSSKRTYGSVSMGSLCKDFLDEMCLNCVIEA